MRVGALGAGLIAVLGIAGLLPRAAASQSEAIARPWEEGAALARAGRYAEAEVRLKAALTQAEKELGPDHVITARLLGSLGQIYHTEGRDLQAEELFRRALAAG